MRNSQPKPGAAEFARRGRVGLRKLAEYDRQLILGNTDACIFDADTDNGLIGGLAETVGIDQHMTRSR